MTIQEMLDVELNSSIWNKKSGHDILRVPGGWIYFDWDYQLEERRVPGTFVPEPKETS